LEDHNCTPVMPLSLVHQHFPVFAYKSDLELAVVRIVLSGGSS
jgi:hypothetical protein